MAYVEDRQRAANVAMSGRSLARREVHKVRAQADNNQRVARLARHY
jgi:uncharacterized protein (DUF2384 family)